MKARVLVRLKPGILDVQGSAIARALGGLGFDDVRELRVGKVIEVEIADADAGRARARVDEMCKKLLANPVIEDYTIELGTADDLAVARSGR
ncbi:MAG TPA: phosphoribosylformylglycinamidine synthase subunit PurS [Methylomirabilota bacterium]